jgi:hypothetical protein
MIFAELINLLSNREKKITLTYSSSDEEYYKKD